MMQDGDADIIKATPRVINPKVPPLREQRSVKHDDVEIPPLLRRKKIAPCFRHARQSYLGPVQETYQKTKIEKQRVDCDDVTITDFKRDDIGCYTEM